MSKERGRKEPARKHMKLSTIFEEKPKRWGFRGDPYFWDYLKERAEHMEMIAPDELEAWIKKEYRGPAGTAQGQPSGDRACGHFGI